MTDKEVSFFAEVFGVARRQRRLIYTLSYYCRISSTMGTFTRWARLSVAQCGPLALPTSWTGFSKPWTTTTSTFSHSPKGENRLAANLTISHDEIRFFSCMSNWSMEQTSTANHASRSRPLGAVHTALFPGITRCQLSHTFDITEVGFARARSLAVAQALGCKRACSSPCKIRIQCWRKSGRWQKQTGGAADVARAVPWIAAASEAFVFFFFFVEIHEHVTCKGSYHKFVLRFQTKSVNRREGVEANFVWKRTKS